MRRKQQRFTNNQFGGIAVMTAMLMLPLIIIVGSVLDLARYTYVHTKLSLAIDAAALAGEHYRSISQTTLANNFFNANYPTPIFSVSPTITISSSQTSSSTIVNATGTMPLYFTKVLGLSSISYNITSQATTITLGQNGQTIPPNLGYNSPYLGILPEGSNNSQAYVDNLRVPPLIMQEDHNVTVTFAYENSGYTDSIGYYLVNSAGVIYNVHMLAPAAKSTAHGGPLTPGSSSANLGTLAKGTQIGFFMLSNGNNTNNFSNQYGANYMNPYGGQYIFTTSTNPGSKSANVPLANIYTSSAPYLYYYATPTSNPILVQTIQGSNQGIFHSVASASNNTLKLNASNMQEVVGYGNMNGVARLGFEDTNLATQHIDSDFNDVAIDVNLGVATTDALFNNTRIVLSDPNQY